MSDTNGVYSFLPFVRQGLGIAINNAENAPTQPALRTTVALSVNVKAQNNAGTVDTHTFQKSVDLISPGDITGISQKSIIRTEPARSVNNFEPNYLAYIDFFDIDFPWRYTPAAALTNRQTPWVALVVLKSTEFERTGFNDLLSTFKCTVDPATIFPKFSELWCWGHVQANDHLSNTGFVADLESKLTTNPDIAFSRIMCPRRLEKDTSYTAFLIPAFELGRLTGLKTAVPTGSGINVMTPSWAAGRQNQDNNWQFPVYFEWDFQTSTTGDFESLVSQLKPTRVNANVVGFRPMDIQDPGLAGLQGISPVPALDLPGALRPDDAIVKYSVDDDTWPIPWTKQLIKYLDKMPPVFNSSLKQTQVIDERGDQRTLLGGSAIQFNGTTDRLEWVTPLAGTLYASAFNVSTATIESYTLTYAVDRYIFQPASSKNLFNLKIWTSNTASSADKQAFTFHVAPANLWAFLPLQERNGAICYDIYSNKNAAIVSGNLGAMHTTGTAIPYSFADFEGYFCENVIFDQHSWYGVLTSDGLGKLVIQNSSWYVPATNQTGSDLFGTELTVNNTVNTPNVKSPISGLGLIAGHSYKLTFLYTTTSANNIVVELNDGTTTYFTQDLGGNSTTPKSVTLLIKPSINNTAYIRIYTTTAGAASFVISNMVLAGLTIVPKKMNATQSAIGTALSYAGRAAFNGSIINNPCVQLNGMNEYGSFSFNNDSDFSQVQNLVIEVLASVNNIPVSGAMTFFHHDAGGLTFAMQLKNDGYFYLYAGGLGNWAKFPSTSLISGTFQRFIFIFDGTFTDYQQRLSFSIDGQIIQPVAWSNQSTNPIANVVLNMATATNTYMGAAHNGPMTDFFSGKLAYAAFWVDHIANINLLSENRFLTSTLKLFHAYSTGGSQTVFDTIQNKKIAKNITVSTTNVPGIWTTQNIYSYKALYGWSQFSGSTQMQVPFTLKKTPLTAAPSGYTKISDNYPGAFLYYNEFTLNFALGLCTRPRTELDNKIVNTAWTGLDSSHINGNKVDNILLDIKSPVNDNRFVDVMIATLNQQQGYQSSQFAGDPVISAPLYGRWHALKNTVDNSHHDWFHKVNLSPVYRVFAGAGAEVVRKNQEQYMNIAWSQVGPILEANKKIRILEAGYEAAKSSTARWITDKPHAEVIALTSSTHTMIKNGSDTVYKQTLDSKIPDGIIGPLGRKATRPNGYLSKNLSTTSNVLSHANVIEEFNAGTVTAAPAYTTPSGVAVITMPPGLYAPGSITSLPPNRANFALSVSGTAPINSPVVFFGVNNGLANMFTPAMNVLNIKIFTASIALPDPPRQSIDLSATATAIKTAMAPDTIFLKYLNRTVENRDVNNQVVNFTSFSDIMKCPKIDLPMYKELYSLSNEFLMPGLNSFTPNTVTLLKQRQDILEAFFVGLNHEMAKELLWREYPTDQRGTIFQKFWEATLASTISTPTTQDQQNLLAIKPIHLWKNGSALTDIGTNSYVANPNNLLILTVRGELLKKYPNTYVYAVKAKWKLNGSNQPIYNAPRELEDENLSVNQSFPIFKAQLNDILFLGFNLTEDQVKGSDMNPPYAGPYTDPGWFFVFKEIVTETHFGMAYSELNQPSQTNYDSWQSISWQGMNDKTNIDLTRIYTVPTNTSDHAYLWGADAADMAWILQREPKKVAFHAKEMLI